MKNSRGNLLSNQTNLKHKNVLLTFHDFHADDKILVHIEGRTVDLLVT